MGPRRAARGAGRGRYANSASVPFRGGVTWRRAGITVRVVSELLTPETTARLLSRFHDFDDAVVLGVELTFSYGPGAARPNAVLTLQAQDQTTDGAWRDVTLSLVGVVSYRLTESSREFHRVLSDGLSILWNE